MGYARVALVAAALAFVGAAVLAGETPPLAPGTRVRVEVSHAAEKIAGRLLALDDESLSLQVENAKEPRVYGREHVTALAVSEGRRSRGRGALIGGGIGAAVGAMVGIATASESDPDALFDISWSRGEGALGGALLMAPVGALIGLAIPPGERWKDVPLDSVEVSVRPVPGRGAGVFVTVAF